jgi:hypothetical protein
MTRVGRQRNWPAVLRVVTCCRLPPAVRREVDGIHVTMGVNGVIFTWRHSVSFDAPHERGVRELNSSSPAGSFRLHDRDLEVSRVVNMETPETDAVTADKSRLTRQILRGSMTRVGRQRNTACSKV